MHSERAITEKQRVSLTVPILASIVGLVITLAGAWYSLKAEASSAAAGHAEDARELRVHDRRIQRMEDVVLPALLSIDKRLERIEGRQERGH